MPRKVGLETNYLLIATIIDPHNCCIFQVGWASSIQNLLPFRARRLSDHHAVFRPLTPLSRLDQGRRASATGNNLLDVQFVLPVKIHQSRAGPMVPPSISFAFVSCLRQSPFPLTENGKWGQCANIDKILSHRRTPCRTEKSLHFGRQCGLGFHPIKPAQLLAHVCRAAHGQFFRDPLL